MDTVIIFYKYVHITYPHAIQKWQFSLCRSLNLLGRIILGTEGINGTLQGSKENIELYKKAMLEHPLFATMDFKDDSHDYSSDKNKTKFPRLRIVIRNEITNMGQPHLTTEKTGNYLTPQETHELLAHPPDNLVILDARNRYESKIGAFTNAVKPPIDFFRQLPEYIDNNTELFKDKTVLMYCTAGIRCEKATAYLNTKGIAQKIYQIKGGIHRYVEEYPDGFFRGKNYVFDGRITVKINDDIVGTCDICTIPCDEITNCINAECNKQFVACSPCLEKINNTCDHTCKLLVNNKSVRIRTNPAKV